MISQMVAVSCERGGDIVWCMRDRDCVAYIVPALELGEAMREVRHVPLIYSTSYHRVDPTDGKRSEQSNPV